VVGVVALVLVMRLLRGGSSFDERLGRGQFEVRLRF
jgi:hypothetical protein